MRNPFKEYFAKRALQPKQQMKKMIKDCKLNDIVLIDANELKKIESHIKPTNG